MTQDNTTSSKSRIAKNTGLLYIRMFLMMAVGLFTSRIILQVLGSSDYGIYNIIGGVVVLFSFINGALTSATQRYLNYYIGRDDEKMTGNVFSMSMNIYILLSLIFLILAETVGLWFVNTQLNIPDNRMGAALWIYQFTVFSFMLNLTRIPYNASLIAYEKMNIYAYLSLLDVFLKLGIVYALFISPIDKLICYGFLFLLTDLADNIIYRVYCVRKFDSTRYKKVWNKSLFKELFCFSGWSLLGNAASVLAQQGLNILVNIFYGVTLNAALGIANQVSSKVVQFFTNFQTAFNPQIVKSYAAGKNDEFFNLIYITSKFSYFLLFTVSLPLMLEIDKMLELWLVDVPKYTAIFCQLILVFSMLEAFTAPLYMSVQATGKIRNYQILVSSINFTTIPLVYLVLVLEFPVWSVWSVRIIVDLVIIVARILYLHFYTGLSLKGYLTNSVYPVILTTIIVIPIPILCSIFIKGYWINLIFTFIISLCVSVLGIFFVGLTYSERNKMKLVAINKLYR